MNLNSQCTVQDSSVAETSTTFPDQQLKSAEQAFDATQQLCTATGGA